MPLTPGSPYCQRYVNNVFINLITGKRTVPLLQWDVRLNEIRDTWDYIGVNIYGGTDVAFDLRLPKMGFVKLIDPSNGHTGDRGPKGDIMFGEIYPQGIEIVVKKLAHYGKPFFILKTESRPYRQAAPLGYCHGC
jgi:beta-glucosidase/6-phospho-beta-glucosidase/beta-galactosidase